MSLIPGFLHDVFISYAHIDNRRSATQAKGWIDQFRNELSLLLIQRFGREANIWYDNTNLDNSTVFDGSIKKGVVNSAIIICINSPSYNNSEYCLKELEFFHTKAINDLVIADRSRIVHVLLNNIPHKTWPSQLAGATGFRFFDSKGQDHLGDRVKVKSGKFEKEMRDLKDSVANLINDMIARQRSDDPIKDELNIDRVEATIAEKNGKETHSAAETLPAKPVIKQEAITNEVTPVTKAPATPDVQKDPVQKAPAKDHTKSVSPKITQEVAEPVVHKPIGEKPADIAYQQTNTLETGDGTKPFPWMRTAVVAGVIILLAIAFIWKPWAKAASATTAIIKKDPTSTVKYAVPDNEKIRQVLLHLNKLKDSTAAQQKKATSDVLDTLFDPAFKVKLRYDSKTAAATPMDGTAYLSDLYLKNHLTDIMVIRAVSLNHKIDSIEVVEIHENKLDIKIAH